MITLGLETTPYDETCIPAGEPGQREEALRMVKGIRSYFRI